MSEWVAPPGERKNKQWRSSTFSKKTDQWLHLLKRHFTSISLSAASWWVSEWLHLVREKISSEDSQLLLRGQRSVAKERHFPITSLSAATCLVSGSTYWGKREAASIPQDTEKWLQLMERKFTVIWRSMLRISRLRNRWLHLLGRHFTIIEGRMDWSMLQSGPVVLPGCGFTMDVVTFTLILVPHRRSFLSEPEVPYDMILS